MEHIILSQDFQSIKHNEFVSRHTPRPNLLTRFLAWCDTQEEKRLLWLAIALLVNIGMVLPLTLLAVLFASGNSFTLWMVALTANVPVLVVNLAAQPTKFTLPVLFIALVINLIIVLWSITLVFGI